MTWQTFGGELNELYWAIVKERCLRDGIESDDVAVAQQFRLHLHRGISYLATPNAITNISDLVSLAVESSAK